MKIIVVLELTKTCIDTDLVVLVVFREIERYKKCYDSNSSIGTKEQFCIV